MTRDGDARKRPAGVGVFQPAFSPQAAERSRAALSFNMAAELHGSLPTRAHLVDEVSRAYAVCVDPTSAPQHDYRGVVVVSSTPDLEWHKAG